MSEKRGKPLPDHLIASIRRLRRQGFSIREIARVVGVCTRTVQKYLGDHA